MTEVPFTPEDRVYQDTILAFQDFRDVSSIGARIDPDPLGPVNQIVRLTVNGRPVRSVLYPVPAGKSVKVGRDSGSPRVTLWSSGWDNLGDLSTYRPPSLYVEIGGKRVIDVPEHETHPPITPRPPVPWRVRARKAIDARARALANRVAKRFGYVHEDDWEDYS